jgi:archaellum component FlaC
MYTERLSAIETEWADVKVKIKVGGNEALAALVSVEMIERRVKSVKSAVEGALLALGVSDDDEFETEHVTEVADASDEIDELAEIEEEEDNEDHSDLKRLTQAHRTDAARVVALKQKFESRSAGMRQLFGDDRGSLDELRLVINKNTERLQAMEAVATEVEDTELGTMMEKRIAELKEQNAKLQTFVDAQSVTPGLFGWLFNWF